MTPKIPLQVIAVAHPEHLTISVSACHFGTSSPALATLTVPGNFPAARSPGQLENALTKSFSRLGDTAFVMDALTVTGDAQCFVPISQLNEIRRKVSARLVEMLEEERQRHIGNVIEAIMVTSSEQMSGPPSWQVKIDRTAYAEALAGAAADELIVDVSRDSLDTIRSFLASNSSPRPALRLALPIITRAWERDDILSRIDLGLRHGCRRWQIANLSGLQLLREAAGEDGFGELDVSADWPLYVINHLQPTCYLYAHKMMGGHENTRFRFDVVTKTKTPTIQTCLTRRDPGSFLRLVELVRTIEKAVRHECFIPNEQSWRCRGCEYGLTCQAWHKERHRSLHNFQLAA